MVCMSINKFFDIVIWWQWNSLHNQHYWIWALRIEFYFMEFYVKILHGFFLYCHEQIKKHLETCSRSLFLEAKFCAYHREKEGIYFVHWCMKILAKRKKRKQIFSMKHHVGHPRLWGKEETTFNLGILRGIENKYYAHEYLIFNRKEETTASRKSLLL